MVIKNITFPHCKQNDEKMLVTSKDLNLFDAHFQLDKSSIVGLFLDVMSQVACFSYEEKSYSESESSYSESSDWDLSSTDDGFITDEN